MLALVGHSICGLWVSAYTALENNFCVNFPGLSDTGE